VWFSQIFSATERQFVGRANGNDSHRSFAPQGWGQAPREIDFFQNGDHRPIAVADRQGTRGPLRLYEIENALVRGPFNPRFRQWERGLLTGPECPTPGGWRMAWTPASNARPILGREMNLGPRKQSHTTTTAIKLFRPRERPTSLVPTSWSLKIEKLLRRRSRQAGLRQVSRTLGPRQAHRRRGAGTVYNRIPPSRKPCQRKHVPLDGPGAWVVRLPPHGGPPYQVPAPEALVGAGAPEVDSGVGPSAPDWLFQHQQGTAASNRSPRRRWARKKVREENFAADYRQLRLDGDARIGSSSRPTSAGHVGSRPATSLDGRLDSPKGWKARRLGLSKPRRGSADP